MRYVRPIHEIGEFDEPVLILVGSIILAIPFQEVEGVQDVADALAVQDEVAGDLVSANHNRRGRPKKRPLRLMPWISVPALRTKTRRPSNFSCMAQAGSSSSRLASFSLIGFNN